MTNKTKYIVGFVLLIGLAISVSIHYSGDTHTVRIIKAQEISLSFVASGSTTKLFGRQKGCPITINGSYFGRNSDGSFFPAGVRYSGMDIVQAASPDQQDPNLQVTLAIQQGTSKIQILSETPLPLTGKIIVNAGPMLISKGVLNNKITQNISHRTLPYPRTLLVITDKQEVFFVLVLDAVSLHEAAEIVAGEGQFGDHYDVINLDGGPSTSFYKQSTPQEEFNTQEVLPIFFCIK